ncbi:MAG: hypothetical protein ACREQL_10820 [Candidatus Binatia bacterium]
MTERDELHAILGDLEVPPPPRDLVPRVLASAAPLLALYARRAAWRTWLPPLAAALVPLPFGLAFDLVVLRAMYVLLTSLLPPMLGTYLVAQYALVLLLVLALTYAAIPVLAERQWRAVLEESHA